MYVFYTAPECLCEQLLDDTGFRAFVDKHASHRLILHENKLKELNGQKGAIARNAKLGFEIAVYCMRGVKVADGLLQILVWRGEQPFQPLSVS